MRERVYVGALCAAVFIAAFAAELSACGGAQEESQDAQVDTRSAEPADSNEDATAKGDTPSTVDVTVPDADAGPLPKVGLALWLASDVGVTAPQDYVKRWADQSGHGRDAVASFGGMSGPAPVKVWPARPGVTVLGFVGEQVPVDKLGPYFDVDLAWLASVDGFTVFVVVGGGQGYRNPSNDLIAAGAPSWPTPTCCVDQGRHVSIGLRGPSPFVDGGVGGVYVDRTCGAASSSIVGAQDDVRIIRAAYSPKTGLYTVRQNGGPAVDDGAVSCAPGAKLQDLDGGAGWIGHSPADGEYRGLLAEIVGYERELAADESVVVESYLRAKWGTP